MIYYLLIWYWNQQPASRLVDKISIWLSPIDPMACWTFTYGSPLAYFSGLLPSSPHTPRTTDTTSLSSIFSKSISSKFSCRLAEP